MTLGFPSHSSSEKLDRLAAYIGATPLLRFHKLEPHPGVKIFAKAEWQQLGGSVKARPAYAILKEALPLLGSRRLIDATSGNTGIAYATFCAAADLPLTLCIPENASHERKNMLRWLRAELVLTSPYESTEGAQDAARELAEAQPHRYFYLNQYANSANWESHFHSTAQEIWHQTSGQITHFIAGLGTTGTFTGTARGLKEKSAAISTIALQPQTALHGLEGWKHLQTARIPEIFDASLADDWQEVSTEAAYHMMKRVAREEGLLLSPSAGANLAGARALASTLESGVIVTILADDASKYQDLLKQLP